MISYNVHIVSLPIAVASLWRKAPGIPTRLLSSLGATQATSAEMHGLAGSVDHDLDPSDVGLPGSVGFPIGVGHVLTEHNALSANTALCHI